MMEAALEGLAIPGKQRPLLIAVTQLTSTSEARMQEDLLDLPQPGRDGPALREKRLRTRGWTASSAPRWRLGKFTPPAALTS